ncbi:hypothetical protein D9V37_18740 [Nocardioides mangrovicus]|uniref:Uncharacterized protein n=1 Tax=Nocardioides mangrovicus TaxID=2478913 RepID=A0A3L8NZM5_9ACTN|nr:hypothetical protein [Nocardioides mangrovicus]RLV48117.1 hypothetical protein D9V37_18740 [Nocardioides mangrovicus]
MSPLQRIALGWVVVFGVALFPAHPHPAWRHYDALPDPLGWALVLTGLVPLARQLPELASARGWAVLAGVVSVPLWLPQLSHHVTGAGAWAALLPQNLACLVLCRAIGRLGAEQQPRDDYVAKRFGLLGWGFTALAVLPVLTVGGRLQPLELPAQALMYLVVLVGVYSLFRVHRRTYLGGPGPLLVDPARPEDRPD